MVCHSQAGEMNSEEEDSVSVYRKLLQESDGGGFVQKILR